MTNQSVLAVVNGKHSDAEIVRLACKLVGPKKSKLNILYIIEMDRTLPIDAEIVADTAKAESILECMENIPEVKKIESEGEIVQARNIGAAVVKEAYEKKVEMIVFGVSDGQQYGNPSGDKTISYLLKNSPCNVIFANYTKFCENGK